MAYNMASTFELVPSLFFCLLNRVLSAILLGGLSKSIKGACDTSSFPKFINSRLEEEDVVSIFLLFGLSLWLRSNPFGVCLIPKMLKYGNYGVVDGEVLPLSIWKINGWKLNNWHIYTICKDIPCFPFFFSFFFFFFFLIIFNIHWIKLDSSQLYKQTLSQQADCDYWNKNIREGSKRILLPYGLLDYTLF